MDTRSYSAAFLYFVLVGFTGGQFFPGKEICFFHMRIFRNVSFLYSLCFLWASHIKWLFSKKKDF